jgi:hypothetical protein
MQIPDSVKEIFSEPYYWKIKLLKNGDYGILRYEEKGRKPDNITEKEFKKGTEILMEYGRKLKEIDRHSYFKIFITVDEYTVKMKLRTYFDILAGGLALEFLQYSSKVRHLIIKKQLKLFLIGYIIGLLFGLAAAAAYFLKNL